MKRDDYIEQRIAGFIPQWIAMLTRAMALSGRGYRRHSLKHTGVGEDRRKDKLESNVPKRFRQYQNRYESVPMRSTRERA